MVSSSIVTGIIIFCIVLIVLAALIGFILWFRTTWVGRIAEKKL